MRPLSCPCDQAAISLAPACGSDASSSAPKNPVFDTAAGGTLRCLGAEGGIPDSGANPGSGTDDWFYDCAIAVFGGCDTGHQLQLATGWPRTSCYAFVAKDPAHRRKPNPEFLRVLFHSDYGAPFHDAFMQGCKASWWLDREDERAAGAAAAFELHKRRARR